MSVILRDTFIDLHSQDILGKLRSEVSFFFSLSNYLSILILFVFFLQFVTRYAGHVVPVSKVPKGIMYSSAVGGSMYGEPGQHEISELFADLEKEDGDVVAPLFDSSSRREVKPTSSKKSRSSDSIYEDPTTEEEFEENKLAKFWSTSSSTTVGSKIVLLSDILPAVPPKGDFDLEKIRDSLYFFS